jgi:hypothetical protein
MLKDAVRRKFDVVMVWAVDRLADHTDWRFLNELKRELKV